MAPTRKRTRQDRARQYLTGGVVIREDSDDELGYDDHPWEWIWEDVDAAPTAHDATPRKGRAAAAAAATVGRRIVAARMGSFKCGLGDTVLLKADGNTAWVGIICEFLEDEVEGEKMAKFLWFSSEREIRNKSSKRTDFLPVRRHSRDHISSSLLTLRRTNYTFLRHSTRIR
jgi:origin recognition complex subunit 1